MNITLIIGNGFDRALGLKTSYSDFYKWWDKHPSQSKNKYITTMRKEIAESFKNANKDGKSLDNWSDYEIGIGKWSANFENGKLADDFKKWKDETNQALINYFKSLKELSPDYINRKIITDNIIKRSIYFFNSNFWKQNLKGDTIKWNMISLNYTDTLDRIVEIVQTSYKNSFFGEIDKEVLHPHGILKDSNSIVLGVNEKEQIDNTYIREQSGFNMHMIKKDLIEQRSICKNAKEKCIKRVNDSSIVCLYGLSLGDSDKDWWTFLGNWLKKENHQLFILWFLAPEKKKTQDFIDIQKAFSLENNDERTKRLSVLWHKGETLFPQLQQIFTLNKDISITMNLVNAGSFMMGNKDNNDAFLHKVRLTRDFWLGEYVVTQNQYTAIMGMNPSSRNIGGNYPVVQVSWEDALQFCKKLNELFSSSLLRGYEFCLPTEAEWEYAARGGNKSEGFAYSGSNKISKVAWYRSNSNNTIHVVGDKSKKANELGLYDMSGNVWELCLDRCESVDGKNVATNTYRNLIVNPLCNNGKYCVMRGGSYKNLKVRCHVAFRSFNAPTLQSRDIGFRLALTSHNEEETAIPLEELKIQKEYKKFHLVLWNIIFRNYLYPKHQKLKWIIVFMLTICIILGIIYYSAKTNTSGENNSSKEISKPVQDGLPAEEKNNSSKEISKPVQDGLPAEEKNNSSVEISKPVQDGLPAEEKNNFSKEISKPVQDGLPAEEKNNSSKEISKPVQDGLPAERNTIEKDRNKSFTINNIPFKMIYVAAGCFRMGSTSEINASPHNVYLSKDFWIGEYEITQELYESVIGTNPSHFKKGGKYPVEQVRWIEAQEFCQKLNVLFASQLPDGYEFRLPTEAEWEYAARGGKKSKGYKYSGSNDIDSVAWYKDNSNKMTHPVGEKLPNELGIYDITGNVSEWCLDYESSYPNKAVDDSLYTTGSRRAARSGGWDDDAMCCSMSYRYNFDPSFSYYYFLGFRLALAPKMAITSGTVSSTVTSNPLSSESDSGNCVFTIGNGVALDMIYVSAGSFTMGSSDSDAWKDENPRTVTLTKDYWIGKYEITQEQYETIMGTNPSNFKKGAKYPVEEVSWNDAQDFCKKLNSKLSSQLPAGYEFRLPTEAEWEYAARGGKKSKGYKYSGSNDIDSVAWYKDNSGSTTHPVGGKNQNELGICDMTGNVWEWCLDYYDSSTTYKDGIRNPLCTTGSDHVRRGGGWLIHARYCRISNRSCSDPSISCSGLGFRLVLALCR